MASGPARSFVACLFLTLVTLSIACGSDDDGPSASETASGSPGATAASSGGAQSLSVPDGETLALNAGAYRPAEFSPSLAFTVPEGWTASAAGPSRFELTDADGGCICVFQPDQAVDVENQTTGILPLDLTEWLQAHPLLDTTKASSLQVNDIAARQMEAVLKDGVAASNLFSADGAPYGIAPGEKEHIIVVSHPSGPVLIVLRAPTAGFRQFFTAAERIIGSMTFAR